MVSLIDSLMNTEISSLNILENYNTENKVNYDKNNDIYVSVEPLHYQKYLSQISDLNTRIAEFENMKNNEEYFSKIPSSFLKDLDERYWFNTTADGINLRPGLLNGAYGNTKPIKLHGENSHSLIGGRTGSGKSVFLNHIISSLMAEYAPWELDIYLADFKKVEFSRYLSNHNLQPPHIQAVAATSEARYVMSLLEHLYDCLNARERVFSDLSCVNIEEFRDNYNLVLPRIVFIVDEFQQLFLESSASDGVLIDKYLTAIAKKGRATGIHLMFASQEMSGTLNSNVLSNFKMRFALPSSKEVSLDLIGSAKASTDIKRGYVICNDFEQDYMYKVPFIKTYNDEGEITEFEQFLTTVVQLGKEIQPYFDKFKKFYQEEHQRSMKNINIIKDDESVISEVSKIKEMNSHIEDLLVLGESVVYKQLVNDIETVFLESKMKDNIGVLTDNYYNSGYLINLLVRNYLSFTNNYTHHIFNLNDSIYKTIEIDKYLENAEVIYDKKRINLIIDQVREKIKVYDLLSLSKSSKQFALNYIFNIIVKPEELVNNTLFENIQIELTHEFDEDVYSKYIRILKDEFELNDIEEDIEQYEKIYDRYVSLDNKTDLFSKEVIWIVGVENIELQFEQLDIINQAPFINTRFIVIGNDDENHRELFRGCNYLFLNMSNETDYDRYNLNYNKNNDYSFDLKIQNYNTQVSFKKFDTEDLKVHETPSVGIEHIQLI